MNYGSVMFVNLHFRSFQDLERLALYNLLVHVATCVIILLPALSGSEAAVYSSVRRG